jgi:hypothetical protein
VLSARCDPIQGGLRNHFDYVKIITINYSGQAGFHHGLCGESFVPLSASMEIKMRRCTFDLNDKPMSRFDIGAASFPAFSGLDGYVNKRSAACIPGRCPIPPGAYSIISLIASLEDCSAH